LAEVAGGVAQFLVVRQREHVKRMRKCSYCGAEYPDDAVVCAVDQTPLVIEPRGKIDDAARSPFGLAITGGLASLLICTAIYFTIGRIMRDIVRMRGGDLGVPASYDVTDFIHPAITWSLFGIGALCFTFFVCYHRCLKESHGVITAIVSFAIIVSLTFGPMFAASLFNFTRLVPAVLIGMSTGSSAGYYIGAVLQVAVGVWLLAWFRRTPPNTALEPTTTAP
jgi:hypothetical protein